MHFFLFFTVPIVNINCSSSLLTDEVIYAFWLVFPVNSQEINRHSSEHNDQPHSTHQRLRVQTEAQQESPEEQVTHRH